MNTQMTAAVVEKLSAQIGQSIFGEPVTDLIELANRCNALQAATVKQSLTAALEAGNSVSVGQVDARTALIEEAIGCLDLIAVQPPLIDQARRALARALAARQPVAAAIKDFLTVGGEPNTAPNRLTELAQPNLFYIQDTRQVVGNCPVWWGPNGGGYVTRLDEAGRYTEQEAVSQNRTRETDIPWACAEIDALARKTVDCQHMRPRAERLAELLHMESKEVGR